MKGLILAAGFGTRLLPYTRTLPKPLFRILDRPVIAHVIDQLIRAGCEDIYVNTHHLNEKVEAAVEQIARSRKPPVRIHTVFEPEILGTGGAVANLKNRLTSDPFVVMNGDIISSIDLTELVRVHREHGAVATLALHHYPEFNKICLNSRGEILNFQDKNGPWAFTGIQVLSPKIFEYLPDGPVSIIDVYEKLMPSGQVRAWCVDNAYWSDIGTPERFSMTALQLKASLLLDTSPLHGPDISRLTGDGSDRQWFRVQSETGSAVVCDHGIRPDGNVNPSTDEFSAFVHIGSHLRSLDLPVPEIMGIDAFAGLIFTEDLGDRHFQSVILEQASDDGRFDWYKRVCDLLWLFSRRGITGFDPQWVFQTVYYDRQMILEKECVYFCRSFLEDYMNISFDLQALIPEFDHLIDNALRYAVNGLMHRDFQSRNLMVKDNRIYVIDYQSARIGPVQYDLASLLIDPYTAISSDLSNRLLSYFSHKVASTGQMTVKEFEHSFHYCCITRNLQILGAFAFLTMVKEKPFFSAFIPKAIDSLTNLFECIDTSRLPGLTRLIRQLQEHP